MLLSKLTTEESDMAAAEFVRGQRQNFWVNDYRSASSSRQISAQRIRLVSFQSGVVRVGAMTRRVSSA